MTQVQMKATAYISFPEKGCYRHDIYMSVRISYLLGLCFIGPRTRLILSCLSLQQAVRQIVKLEKDTTKAPADKHSQADQLKL